jgi:hypothetical protein
MFDLGASSNFLNEIYLSKWKQNRFEQMRQLSLIYLARWNIYLTWDKLWIKLSRKKKQIQNINTTWKLAGLIEGTQDF